jgi:hypothetical protein
MVYQLAQKQWILFYPLIATTQIAAQRAALAEAKNYASPSQKEGHRLSYPSELQQDQGIIPSV